MSASAGPAAPAGEIIDRNQAFLVDVYARTPIAFVRGAGTELWDAGGRRVLDFFSSILCTNLGHCHPRVTGAICEQARTLVHVSNLHHTLPQSLLAERLIGLSFGERVFLCNSGAEANEAAIKLARKFGHANGGRHEIITALGSFHGRTMATIAATGQEKVRVGFEPNLPGFRYVPFGDLSASEAAVGPDTAAILVEPVQGEGGVVVPPEGYLAGLRDLCDRRDLLLIFDEVQTGCGRTGTLWAHEQAGCIPDVMTLAKSLGNGLPVGAMVAGPRASGSLDRGSHGSTFGGNCVTNAAAVATLDVLTEPETLPRARRASERLRAGLRSIADQHGELGEVRGQGLLLGLPVESSQKAQSIASRALEAGLLINVTAERVLRIAPPLTVSDDEIDEALDILGGAASR